MLRLLIDKDDIRDLLYSYSQMVDRGDYSKVLELYHDDATDEHGINPSGSVKEFLEVLKPIYDRTSGIHHIIANSYIRVEGDYAEAETYFNSHQFGPEKDNEHWNIYGGGRYLDKFVRKNGVWKIQHRRLVTDWLVRSKEEDALAGAWAKNMYKGQGDGSDPSYSFLSLFSRGTR